MKIVTPLFILLFSSLVLAAPAFELTQDFENQDDFAIHLPQNWVEIPSKVLRQYSKTVSRGVGESLSYDYGFQLAPVDKWLTHPYILIQVKRSGRIPERVLNQYKQISVGVSKGIREAQDEWSKLSNAQLGETLYDTENEILWMNLSVDVRRVGRVNGQVAVKLTDFGYIQVMGYATKDTFSSYQSLFQEIAKQMTLADSIKYTDNEKRSAYSDLNRVVPSVALTLDENEVDARDRMSGNAQASDPDGDPVQINGIHPDEVVGFAVAVQMAAYLPRQQAAGLRAILQDHGYSAYVVETDIPGSGRYYRVRVGPFETREEAKEVAANMQTSLSEQLPDFWIVPFHQQ
ncbi:SPOR domain-containing protein [Acidobacteria bacterium AH-259-D05]|nr:SPOR domain-containing protein [Acidobacteria bacterium AH-259-D05]